MKKKSIENKQIDLPSRIVRARNEREYLDVKNALHVYRLQGIAEGLGQASEAQIRLDLENARRAHKDGLLSDDVMEALESSHVTKEQLEVLKKKYQFQLESPLRRSN